MNVNIVVIIAAAWACCLVAAREEVCSTLCNTLGMLQNNPGKSCDHIYQMNQASRGVSGTYWIQTTTGVHQVYCDMELECGGQKGGWMRIADLDASRGDDCPSGWTKITTNDAGQPSIDVCRPPSNNAGCYPTTFSVHGASYRKICGKARGYQRQTTDAFDAANKGINGAYVDGISITLGRPRKHVWTYAVGHEDTERTCRCQCPCAHSSGAAAHSFIGSHYYCESGAAEIPTAKYYTSDPLWDSSECVSPNNNCCTNIGMPWFYQEFPIAQKDAIEARICTDQVFNDEGVAVDELLLFVQETLATLCLVNVAIAS